MVIELKKRIDSGKVFFGLKESLKNSEKIAKVKVTSDCRDEIISLLEEKNLEVELLEISKEDITNKLELDFKCEVFGLEK